MTYKTIEDYRLFQEAFKKRKRKDALKRYYANHEENKAKRRELARQQYAANPTKRRKASRKHNLKKYGLTENEHYDLLKAQNDSCAICGKAQKQNNRSFAVDHDHKTGKIRGLLCDQCNRGLGFFKDDIQFLEQ